jgi:hypothetical protein
VERLDFIFAALDLGLGAAAFVEAFLLAEERGFEVFAFLALLSWVSLRFAASEDALARRCAVFAIWPTADPTPRAIAVSRSVGLAAFLGMIDSSSQTLRGRGLTGDRLLLPPPASAATDFVLRVRA